ncbi:MAG: type II toxin-antitoxin system YafQ family toxin [Caldilineaceae bacterium]|nr:type II toxin-antitoxin system YafQ family toxin [Caldilineaceae bacterium]MBP8109166.1 type II toxin-antitoxin system YafQ family toxin [Caldilineaceae bacterium]MBP8124467.1 type II toxin-antitoxin system YafQ family toxin [Caldilineaceae bacterium]MBP9071202.1 type II toxin-antitoxin system YafQ family toxin [Caldilineaceae bacterium]
MLLTIHQSTRFRRDVKRLGKQGAELSKLESVIRTLVAQSPLDERLRDHALTGNWRGYRDCHIQPDWLLLYRVVDDELQLARTGSHADLFGK